MSRKEVLSLDEIRRIKRVRVIRASLATLAGLLTKKGIVVTVSGKSAFCVHSTKTGEPERINLPSIPDDASDNLIDVTQGFLDHECAHALFTDFFAILEANNMGLGQTHNIYEDVFIERKNVEVFPGSRATLPKPRYRLIEFILKLVKGLEAKGVDDEEQWYNLLSVCAARAWAGHIELVDFMNDNDLWSKIPNVVEAMRKRGVVDGCKYVKDSWHALDLARAHRDAMLDFEKKREEGEDSSEEGESGEGSGEESGEEGESGEGTSGSSGEEGESGEETSGELDDDDAKPDDESAESAKKENGGSAPELGEDSAMSSTDTSAREWKEPEPVSIEKVLEATIDEEMTKAISGDSYVPFRTDLDRVFDQEVTPSAIANVDRLENRVSSIVGAMQSQLEGIVLAMKLDRWQSGLRTGRINASSLHRLSTGDDRVFRKRDVRETKNSAVSILVDCSGSMSNDNRYAAAAESAWALGETLDRIGVPCEIIGFTTAGAPSLPPEAWEFSRMETISMPVFKHFDQPFDSLVKARLAMLWGCSIAMQNNVDGESVRIASDRLLARPEERHILITLSDGFPAAQSPDRSLNRHLKQVVSSLGTEGVECVGIGIQSKSVEKFYPNSIVLNDVTELAGAALTKMKELLVPQ